MIVCLKSVRTVLLQCSVFERKLFCIPMVSTFFDIFGIQIHTHVMRVCTLFFSNMDYLICQIQIRISRQIQIRQGPAGCFLNKNIKAFLLLFSAFYED